MTASFQSLSPIALTKEAFTDFGDVIEASQESNSIAINHGFTQRFHDLAHLDLNQQNGKTLLSIFRSTPLPKPITIKLMERHPLSSQAFMPLGENPYLVVVAPAGEFDETKISVFLAQAHQGVNYHKGTWHHFSLALNSQSDFLVIDRGGDEHNCDEVMLERPFQIEIS